MPGIMVDRRAGVPWHGEDQGAKWRFDRKDPAHARAPREAVSTLPNERIDTLREILRGLRVV